MVGFAAAGALDKLEGFASRFGAAFYGLPVNDCRLTLIADAWQAPSELRFSGGRLTPLRAGERHAWRLVA